MKYAIIENKTVTNVIEINPRNAVDFPTAVIAKEYPVNIEDTYENDKFYRDGEELLSYAELQRIAEESYDPNSYVEPVSVKKQLETYKTALNTVGVETEEVTE